VAIALAPYLWFKLNALNMSTQKVTVYNNSLGTPEILVVGKWYEVSLTEMAGYGIIVIEDTLRVEAGVVGTYNNGNLLLRSGVDYIKASTVEGEDSITLTKFPFYLEPIFSKTGTLKVQVLSTIPKVVGAVAIPKESLKPKQPSHFDD
jgi:hypothetical protein